MLRGHHNNRCRVHAQRETNPEPRLMYRASYHSSYSSTSLLLCSLVTGSDKVPHLAAAVKIKCVCWWKKPCCNGAPSLWGADGLSQASLSIRSCQRSQRRAAEGSCTELLTWLCREVAVAGLPAAPCAYGMSYTGLLPCMA